MAEETIAEATATAVGGKKKLSTLIEEAMSEAILEASRQAITDPAEIKAMMMDARQKVIDEWNAQPSTEAPTES